MSRYENVKEFLFTERESRVLRLRDKYQNLGRKANAKIAEELGIPQSSVRRFLSKARRKLAMQDQLAAQNPGGCNRGGRVPVTDATTTEAVEEQSDSRQSSNWKW